MLLRFALCLVVLALAPPAMAQDSRLHMLLSGDEVRGWEGVGRLEIAGKGFCTAAMVSETEVLTAAHCLFDREGAPLPPGAMQFAAGYRDGRALAARAVRRVAPHPGFDPLASAGDQGAGTDIALIELQAPIRGTQVMPFAVGPMPRRGHDVGVVSYAVERADAPSLQEICGVLDTLGAAMVLSCEVDFGSSGAPVFALSAGRAAIVGVVTAKAFVGVQQVSVSAAAEDSLAVLRAALSAQTEGVINRVPQVRVIGPGERNGEIGAKFLRP